MAYQQPREGNGLAPQKGQKPRGPPPALNPETPAVTQPFKDFIQKGFITTLVVEFTPMGTGVSCTVRNDLLNSGETKDTKIAIGDAKNRIIEKKLWTPGNKGQKSSAEKSTGDVAPKKTLRKEDLQLGDKDLLARAIAVAKALGDSTARGRIGSLNLMMEGVDTFEKWWPLAAASERTRLLMDKKHHDTLDDAEHLRVSALVGQCPFRGPVPQLPEEEEEEKAAAPSSSKALVQKKKGAAK